MKAVQLSQLKKAYFGRSVLDDLSFELDAGKFYALVGQNGAGKSTLMRILNHSEAPDSGSGTVMGMDLGEDPKEFALEVGYISEELTFPSWTSSRKFIQSICSLYPKWNQREFERMVAEFGLELDVPFGTLSRGLRMQVCMSFIFAIQPRLLLLDEVTAVLDARARAMVIRYCKNFVAGGGTVIMATNIVSETHHAADSLIYLENSKIRLIAAVEEVSRSFLKLRRIKGAEHAVFHHPDCLELRIGDDDSVVCLIPVSSLAGEIPQALHYPGPATTEDVFIYFTQKAQRERK